MIGQTISHYRITGRLGSGGMGVVYEAQDLTLGRRVALKFLPPQLATDTAALDRFLLEARAASALNHPNICTIYAVEKDGGQSFIAMELLEGQSLDTKLSGGLLPLDSVLDISTQLADALDAAHAKGIIHRDIKPANIFLVQRAQVKILDFGLAKLTRTPEPTTETVAIGADVLPTANLTNPGSTVGTVAFMSPEQARGEQLDPRSDLFSLGAVIYQMTTGQLPFTGSTSAVIFNAILERDPIPAVQLNPQLPPKLQEIIGKLLEKDRDLRYQSAADLRGDLKRLKRDTDSGRKPAQTPSASTFAQPVATPQSSGSARVVTAAREHKLGTGVATLIAAVVLAAAAYGIYAFVNRSRPAPFQNISIDKITNSGKARLAAISPDGKYILNVVKDNGQESLWLRNVPTNSNTQVVPPGDVTYLSLNFSPDGDYLYFTRFEPGSQELKFLYRAPVLGGTPQKLVTDIDSRITFSPDGKEFAYSVYNNPDVGKYRLVIQSLDGGQSRDLVTGPADARFDDPSWSPDGKTILGISGVSGDSISTILGVDVKDGSMHPVFSSKDAFLSLPTWLPGGRGLVLLARDKSSNFTRGQVVFLPYPPGTLHPVTRDTNGYSALSIAADGRTIATVSNDTHSNVFVTSSAANAGQPKPVTTGGPAFNLSWTVDGQIITDQDLSLARINPDSGAKTLLATGQDFFAVQPSVCADGRFIVFSGRDNRNMKLSQNVWRMDAGGGNLKQLSNGKLDVNPVCSPDGRFALYNDAANDNKLTKVPLEGGASQIVSDELIVGFDVSADGKMVAAVSFHHAGGHEEKLVLIAMDSGQVVKTLDLGRPRQGAIRFTNDGKAIAYPILTGDADNLWVQPLDGSPGKQITSFTTERIFDFHWSRDGSKLGLTRGHTDSDVVLVRDSQQ